MDTGRVLHLGCILLLLCIDDQALSENVTCIVPEAMTCLTNRQLQYELAIESLTKSNVLDANAKALCLTQINVDSNGACFERLTKMCSDSEAASIRANWTHLNGVIMDNCQEVCPNIAETIKCKNMTDTSQLKESRFEKFCSTYNISLGCAQRQLADCIFGINLYYDVWEPTMKRYWNNICNSGCKNIDDTVAVIKKCIDHIDSAKSNCLDHANFRSCVFESKVICKEVLTLIRLTYAKYDSVEDSCRVTTSHTKTERQTTLTNKELTTSFNPTQETSTSYKETSSEVTQLPTPVPITSRLSDTMQICISNEDLATVTSGALTINHVLLILRFEQCIYHQNETILSFANVSLNSTMTSFLDSYHKVKTNGWNVFQQSTDSCIKKAQMESKGCTGHSYGLLYCGSAVGCCSLKISLLALSFIVLKLFV